MTPLKMISPALIALSAAPAFAAGGGGEHGFPLWTLIYSAINVTIFFLILRRFAWPGIQQWVRDRHDRIVADLAAAANAKSEAVALKEQWQSRLDDLDEEIADMRKKAQQDAEAERERIIAEARNAAARIKHDAEVAAEAEQRQISAELQASLARQSLELAENQVKKAWKADDQARFIDQFLSEVQP